MKEVRWLLAFGLWLGFCLASASAHDAPTSFLTLHQIEGGIELVLTASTTDLAHDLATVEPSMLLRPEVCERERSSLQENVLSRLTIKGDGKPVIGEVRKIVPLPEKRDLKMTFFFAWQAAPGQLQVHCQLFPYDPRHRTFARFDNGATLEREEIFEGARTTAEFQPGARQSILAVIRQFLLEGMHHIFIGPDHILFLIGLLLLGGSLGQLLKIITAFTVAHSITLGLATFNLVTPPPGLIEPAIALTIVVVGLNSLLAREKRDPRILFAFCFGLIHGFGFANALREMMLPRYALGWSLFAFNGGVEIGQACIVIVAAPVLAFLRRQSEAAARRTVTLGSLGVITAGAFWFFQRVIG